MFAKQRSFLEYRNIVRTHYLLHYLSHIPLPIGSHKAITQVPGRMRRNLIKSGPGYIHWIRAVYYVLFFPTYLHETSSFIFVWSRSMCSSWDLCVLRLSVSSPLLLIKVLMRPFWDVGEFVIRVSFIVPCRPH